jgi:hypothetical protein
MVMGAKHEMGVVQELQPSHLPLVRPPASTDMAEQAQWMRSTGPCRAVQGHAEEAREDAAGSADRERISLALDDFPARPH